MGSRTSRIGSDPSSQPSRLKRTKRMLSSILLCGRTSSTNSTSHPSVLELESPVNSIENLPPASVESISSAGVSTSFFGSEAVCTSSKSSESEAEGSESHTTEEPMLGNHGSDPVSGVGPQSVVNEGRPMSSSTNVTQETHDSDVSSGQNHDDASPRSVDSNTRALLVLSDSFLSLRMFGSSITTSGTGILVVESGSLSPDGFTSGVSDTNSREARRNAGGLSGLFGPVSSRRRYRRESNFPSLLTSLDDFGSRDRWLLDINDDDHHHGHGHGYYRSHGRNEERRHFRSQMSERGLGGVDEEARLCASGLHRDGTCSCVSSFMGEEAGGTLGTISRVVLLAQALSEVLEEIHRQPLSLSMPMLSLPAPESVVDSFLLKSHKKMDASETGPNYVQQCYICLVDYEEGDKIRVLPCQHEYHAPCVDKWLKEVNGVCPVCRCNVCDTNADTQASVSTSELPA